MRKPLYIFCFLIFAKFSALGQDAGLGSWYSAAVVLPGDSLNRWGACTMLQVRNNQQWGHLIYFGVNGGITFFINKSFTATAGFGNYKTFEEVNDHTLLYSTEYRFYEQITNSQFLHRLKLEHRLITEQRWSNEKYSDRFRYRLSIYVPINHTRVEAKTWYFTVSNEVFFSDRLPIFQRNRAAAGLGYQFTRSVIAQAGWVNQYDKTSTQAIDKSYTQLLFIYRIYRKNSTNREYMPSAVN